MRESVSELLSRIDSLEDETQRVEELRKAGNGRLQELLVYALHPNVEFDVPEGMPPHTPDPGIYSHGLFWQEIRRIPLFFKGGKLSHLKERREFLFIELLENIHPDDAKVLNAIKDRKWPYVNINREIANKAFPNLIGE